MNARSAALEVEVGIAHVERTLPSVAFDAGSDFVADLDFDLDFRVTTNAGTTVEERRLSAA